MGEIARFIVWQLKRKEIYLLLGSSLLMYFGWAARSTFRESIYKSYKGPY